MPATVRRLQKGEEAAFIRSVRVPFLDPSLATSEDEADDRRRAASLEVDRTWVAEDGGRFVGNCLVRSMDLTTPSALGQACPIVRMGGVSAVGVHPTHRRQGLLSRMMETMLDDSRSRGEPFAGLIASESIIYGRFGFGLASDSAEYEIDSVRSAFTGPVRDVGLRLLEKDEARKALPDIWERTRRGRPGEPNRTSEFWDEYFKDDDAVHHRAGGMFFAVCEDGYASYRASPDDDVLRGARVGVTVEEVWGVEPDVEAALWRFVLDLDLVGSVTFRRRPVDEPVRWRLKDPRQLRTKHIDDRLYVRILDVPQSLQQRGYRSEGRLIIDVRPADVSKPDDPAVGTWLLEAGPDGASCTPAPTAAPDLRMRVTDLGSIYLGGFKASTLAAAGLVEQLTPGSLEAADRLFASGPAPLTVTGF